MHQIFYIDANEEVNSIISKIRKSNSKYNILVIAQGALLMQSAVSLKLIKREVDTLDKKVMMIIRDERAASIASKIGFPVKKSLEEVKGLNAQAIPKKTDIQSNMSMNSKNNHSQDLSNIVSKNNRLVNLGSDSFVSVSGVVEPKKDLKEIKEDKSLKDDVYFSELAPENSEKSDAFLEQQEDAFRNLFVQQDKNELPKQKKETHSSGGVLKFIGIFAVIVLVLIGSIAAYFWLPSANVTIFPIKKSENFNLKLNIAEDAENSSDYQNDLINLETEIIEKESTLSLNFDATGQKGDSNQKAKGKITIYNEFSETSQILVVTTRFMSNDEKLFRLLKTVTVPGMTVKDGKVEAGKVEAEIVADEAGEKFNIKEAEFKIPGFKGSTKYDKFYAKLIEETKGGGSSESNLKMVSKSDIESAKFKTEEQLKNQLRDNIKNSIGEENMLLDDAVAFEVTDFSVFPEEGSITEKFEYQVKMKVKGLSFSHKKLDDEISKYIENNFNQKNSFMKLISFENNYGHADIDFTKKTIKMDVSINAKLRSEINREELSKNLAGKNKDELGEVVKNYPEINKVEVMISPSFLANSFPRYPSKIKVSISND
ncbi:MAG: hypothetical protein UR60_C0008G0006 [Candidatus Moranbacteria bacterium GW2011_GWF2_34_56]|nr:MAG: hypothetical protein UR51_C0002G0104 [Candidatus Moranbacteria bacterium GW2011_GWF1_34_10]KKP65134.1 MAG: hypothetical protein UR60_C0008G0006 [Candidatus Moranbacteria bacterium GW2011_GWF2_34_56]HBI16736.1 hypothetical protein [Candidatus Moranbacteria bacterium]